MNMEKIPNRNKEEIGKNWKKIAIEGAKKEIAEAKKHGFRFSKLYSSKEVSTYIKGDESLSNESIVLNKRTGEITRFQPEQQSNYFSSGNKGKNKKEQQNARDNTRIEEEKRNYKDNGYGDTFGIGSSLG